jgi:hypothetical protein
VNSDELDVDTIAREISTENYASISRLFLSQGAEPPTFDWNPDKETLRPVMLWTLLEYWWNLKAKRELPNSVEIDPIDFSFALGNVLLVEFIADREDLRYRVYGTNVTKYSGFDLTGKSIATSNIPPISRAFYLATYKAASLRRAPVFSVNFPSTRETLRQWNRLILPFAGTDGQVDRFIVGIIPIDHIP